MNKTTKILGVALSLVLCVVLGSNTFAATTTQNRIDEFTTTRPGIRQMQNLLDRILTDLNLLETDTIINDSIYLGFGTTNADFQLEFDGSDMKMTGIATVGLTIDLDSGSVASESFNLTGYNLTLSDSAFALPNGTTAAFSGNVTLDDNSGDSPTLTFTDAGESTGTIKYNDTNDTLDILAPQSGEISFGDDNLTTTGTLDAAATTITTLSATTGAFSNNVTLDDNTTDSPTFTLTDASEGTLVFLKPDAAAATITSTTDGLTVQSAATKVLTLAADDASANTENVVVTSWAWGVDAAGDMTFDDDTTDSPKVTWTDASGGTLVAYKPDAAAALISSTTDGLTLSVTPTAKPLTLNVAGGNAADEDIVITAHNFSITAPGVVTIPTTSKLNIIDVGTGLELNSVAVTPTAAELNDCDVDNRASSSLFRMMIGQEKFTVADAASTTIYMAGIGAAFQVDAVSVCASATLPIDAGGVTVDVARVSDSQSVLSGAIDLTTAVQTVNQCTAAGINATPANCDVGATDQLDIVITTDGAVDTNGSEFTLTVWGSLD
jgi:hypothetical protein